MSDLTCPNCGAHHERATPFCEACGARLRPRTAMWALISVVVLLVPVIVFCLLLGACGVATAVTVIGSGPQYSGLREVYVTIGVGIAVVGFGAAVGLIFLAVRLFRNRR